MKNDVQVCLLMRPDLRDILRDEAITRRTSMSRLVEYALVKLFGLSKGGKAQ